MKEINKSGLSQCSRNEYKMSCVMQSLLICEMIVIVAIAVGIGFLLYNINNIEQVLMLRCMICLVFLFVFCIVSATYLSSILNKRGTNQLEKNHSEESSKQKLQDEGEQTNKVNEENLLLCNAKVQAFLSPIFNEDVSSDDLKKYLNRENLLLLATVFADNQQEANNHSYWKKEPNETNN